MYEQFYDSYHLRLNQWCNLHYLPDMDKVSDKTVRGLLTPDLSRTFGCYELAKTCGKMKVLRHILVNSFQGGLHVCMSPTRLTFVYQGCTCRMVACRQ